MIKLLAFAIPFVFWGLFMVFGFILVGYIIWMVWTENKLKP